MSGMTRSIPNISSSGNIRPQSITTISSPYSKTYMFLPISPTPPSGMMRSGMVWFVGGHRFLVRAQKRLSWSVSTSSAASAGAATATGSGVAGVAGSALRAAP